MVTSESTPPEEVRDPDARVVLRGVSWWEFETILAIRGDQAGVRLAYLEGDLEIMSPSATHERVKKMFARLLEAHADHHGIDFEGYGSLTMKNALLECGGEPDECYIVGEGRPEEPNLVIEVEWTRSSIDKRRLYAGLGVRELWLWRRGKILVHTLRGEAYAEIPRTELLPGLDLDLIARLLVSPMSQTAAVREFRKLLRA